MALLPDLDPPSSPKTKKTNQNKIYQNIHIANFLSIKSKLVFFVAQFLKVLESVVLFYRNNTKLLPHAAILSLLAIVLVSNLTESAKARMLSQALFAPTPDEEFSVTSEMDRYTPLIENDPILLDKYILAQMNSEGFASTAAPVNTQLTIRTEPLPDNSNQDVFYVVKLGDTLSQISSKFGVKVATVRFVNNLDNDIIKPGSKIRVPAKGYVVSAAQLAKRNKDKEVKLATARNTVARSTSRSTYSGSYDGDSSVSLIVPLPYFHYISRGVSRTHNGIDYATAVGTPIRAAANGVVIATSSGWSGGYGNQIVVSHGNGVATRYAHLSSVRISSGTVVTQGQIIGYSGNSGNSTGPHLHFEKIVNGRTVNPF